MAGTVGFIGLGNMGRPMALNLVKRGFSLVVHDIDPTKVAPLRDRGAKVVASPEQVAAAAERTIVMVETTAQAESVIAGERGIVKSAPRGHIVICMSTIDPFALRRLAEQLAARGVATLDAPVSGGTERAGSGELSVIAGGDPATFEACRDLFAAMGTKLFHVGALGQGLAMKLVNNMLIQVNRVAVAEALVMGVKAGLDPAVMIDVINAGSGLNTASRDKFPRSVLPRSFDFGFATGLMVKDVRLALEEMKSLGLSMEVAEAVGRLWEVIIRDEGAESDFTAAIKPIEKAAGVVVGGAKGGHAAK